MAALISRTLVGEKRRTQRAIIASAFLRPLNSLMVKILKAEEEDPKKKAKITRAEGYNRARLFNPELNKLLKKIEKVRPNFSDEEYAAIHNSVADDKNKQSTKERKDLENAFKESVKKELKKYKAEQVSGYELTWLMGGKVLLSVLTVKAGYKDHLDAEIVARKMQTEMKEFIEEYGEDSNLDDIGFTKKKNMLKLHEAKRNVEKNHALSLEEALEKTRSIEPFSDMVKALLVMQNEVVEQEGGME